MSQLIILRGNSASGKTTTAKQLQHYFPQGDVMRISQDEIRLGILNVKGRLGQPTRDLIQQLAEFGKGRFKLVVIEGILGKQIYQEMFQELYELFEGNVLTYYYDIPFAETLRRHSQREKAKEFGAERMKKWWLAQDFLGLPNEKRLTAELSQADILAMILKELNRGDKMKQINLKKATLADAALVQSWWNDGRVMAPVGYPFGLKTSLKEVEAAIESYQRPAADFLLIVTENQEVIGEFCYRQRDKTSFTFDIKIEEYSKQGQGYGRLALEQGIELIFSTYQPEKIVIEVNASNHNALHLYRSLGFEKIRFIKDSWTNQVEELCSTVVLELTHLKWEEN